MKQLLLGSLLVLASTSASAACYNFVNGNGPDRIGNFVFGGKAEAVCIQTVQRVGGSTYTSVRLYDRQGDLAITAGQASDSSVQLVSGNINGENVNLNGTEVQVNVQVDARLGITKGVLSIKAGRDFPQKFLIMSPAQ